ncbi:MAG: hypothetical protein WBV85_12085 [Solirubrobacteraceae bacterium]
MKTRTGPPNVAQLCERTRQLIGSARAQSASASLKREQVIRELRFVGRRRTVADPPAQVPPRLSPR